MKCATKFCWGEGQKPSIEIVFIVLSHANRYIHSLLKDNGGTLIMDSDFDDSFQISTFLLDWLTDYEVSNTIYDLVPLSKCLPTP